MIGKIPEIDPTCSECGETIKLKADDSGDIELVHKDNCSEKDKPCPTFKQFIEFVIEGFGHD